MNKLIEACEWVADQVESGRLTPGVRRMYVEGKPCCALGHVLARAGDFFEPRHSAQIREVTRQNDRDLCPERPRRIAEALRALANTIRQDAK